MANSIKPGIYKGRAIVGTEQFGVAGTSSAQVAVDVAIPELGGSRFTVVLQFGGAAGPYSIDRLKALGWDGKDILKLEGLGSKDAEVELYYETTPEGRQRLKCEVRMGDGTFRFRNPMTNDEMQQFAEDVGSLMATGAPPARMAGK